MKRLTMNTAFISQLATMGRWTAPENGIRGWARVYNSFTYKAQEVREGKHNLSEYDVIFVNLCDVDYDIPRLLKERNYKTKVVGILECNCSILKGMWLKNDKSDDIITMFKNCDVVLSQIFGEQKGLYTVIEYESGTPVINIGLPTPLEFKKFRISSIPKPWEELRFFTYATDNFLKGGEHNLLSILYSMKGLQIDNYVIFVTGNLSSKLSFFPKKNVKVIGRGGLNQGQWLQCMSQANVTLLLDNRPTWGRFNIDSALLGIPCISTKNPTAQSILFPNLTVSGIVDYEGVRTCISKIIDKNIYKQILEYSEENLNIISEETAKKTLDGVLKNI